MTGDDKIPCGSNDRSYVGIEEQWSVGGDWKIEGRRPTRGDRTTCVVRFGVENNAVLYERMMVSFSGGVVIAVRWLVVGVVVLIDSIQKKLQSTQKTNGRRIDIAKDVEPPEMGSPEILLPILGLSKGDGHARYIARRLGQPDHVGDQNIVPPRILA